MKCDSSDHTMKPFSSSFLLHIFGIVKMIIR